MKKTANIIDREKLALIVDYLSTVLECVSAHDSADVKRLDSIRISRHRAVCRAFNVDYSYDKREFELEDFSEKYLDKYFDGKVEEAAKYLYMRHIDKANERSGRKTYYSRFRWMRKEYESVKKYAEDAMSDLKKEYDIRTKWAKKNVWDNGKFKEYLREKGIDPWSFSSMHEYNSKKSSISEHLAVFDDFTKELRERDLTQANMDAYAISVRQINELLAPVTLDNWMQNRRFEKAKTLFESFSKVGQMRIKSVSS